jgi:hypothetical protein
MAWCLVKHRDNLKTYFITCALPWSIHKHDQISEHRILIFVCRLIGEAKEIGNNNLSFNPYVVFPAGFGDFSLHHRVKNGSGAHPASCPMGIRGFFPGGKAAGA